MTYPHGCYIEYLIHCAGCVTQANEIASRDIEEAKKNMPPFAYVFYFFDITGLAGLPENVSPTYYVNAHQYDESGLAERGYGPESEIFQTIFGNGYKAAIFTRNDEWKALHEGDLLV